MDYLEKSAILDETPCCAGTGLFGGQIFFAFLAVLSSCRFN
jgi:hypothetical protein